MKPVLVLLPVLGLTWLVGTLVHLSPAWAYAAVGLNSFQVPPGPGPSGTRALTRGGAQSDWFVKSWGKECLLRHGSHHGNQGHCQEARG